MGMTAHHASIPPLQHEIPFWQGLGVEESRGRSEYPPYPYITTIIILIQNKELKASRSAEGLSSQHIQRQG